MNDKKQPDRLGALVQEKLLFGRAVEGDRLVLADATLAAALDGSRALTAGERAALQASPLTLRRLRALSLRAHAAVRMDAANDAAWRGSAGMLRAAASAGALAALETDDRCWTLHLVDGGAGAGWSVILKLAAAAPFAPNLLREQPWLRVVDGDGAVLLQGRLDADGECEHAWPFDDAPADHFRLHGGAFAVEPVAH
jgi:hypothetical protein